MNRFTAFAVLRLKSDATLEEIKAAHFNLLKEANDNSDGNAIEQIRAAYKTILRTQDENIGQEPKFIVGAVAEGQTQAHSTAYKQIVPPYEEAVIKSRIEKLPDRVSCRCCVTGEKFSVELQFNKHMNAYVFLRPLPYQGEPCFSSVTLPVLLGETTIMDTIETTVGSRHEDKNAYYVDAASSEYIGKVNQNYSRESLNEIQLFVGDSKEDSLNDKDAEFKDLKADYSNMFFDTLGMANGADFGHDHACHICGADSYDVCSTCGALSCDHIETWPVAWGSNVKEKVATCSNCDSRNTYKNPKFRDPLKPSTTYDPEKKITEEISGRVQSGAIGHEEKRKLASADPIKRIARK